MFRLEPNHTEAGAVGQNERLNLDDSAILEARLTLLGVLVADLTEPQPGAVPQDAYDPAIQERVDDAESSVDVRLEALGYK